MVHRVVSAILFSPRGGSAHVARALARGLRELEWAVTLVSGSVTGSASLGDAERFYGEVQAVDFAPALASEDPLRFEGAPGTAPMHPSFEDRPGEPDQVFAALDDLAFERQVQAWAHALAQAGAANAHVLHLHHLTPIHAAAERVAPAVPVVTQLHGTELLMLEEIAAGAPAGWRYADRWAERLQSWARRSARLLVAPAGVERAVRLLDVPPEGIVALPNGADVELFKPRPIDRAEFWRRVLVDHPQGWLPGAAPGSARYGAGDAARLADGVVIVYVGRFTAVKALDRLIAAFGRARQRFDVPAGLVLVGGHPGEWEGEHPFEAAARLGVPDVYLTGWYSQEDLPTFYAASDVMAIASRREQFGQVIVEAMACCLPVIAVRSLGPAMIIEDGRTGWLVALDDEPALAEAMVQAVNDPRERRRRGELARTAAVERFSWPSIAARLASVLTEVVDGGGGSVRSAVRSRGER